MNKEILIEKDIKGSEHKDIPPHRAALPRAYRVRTRASLRFCRQTQAPSLLLSAVHQNRRAVKFRPRRFRYLHTHRFYRRAGDEARVF